MIRIEHLYVSAGHNFFGHHGMTAGMHPIIEMDEVECVAARGVRGDRFFDHRADYKGQVTLFAAEVFDALCVHFGLREASPAALRRNVLVRGADLNALIGAEFELQGVQLAGAEECRPCHWMNEVLAAGAETWLRGRGGLRCRVLTSGRWRSAAPVQR